MALVAFAALWPVGCVVSIAARPADEVEEPEVLHEDFATAVAYSYLRGDELQMPAAAGVDRGLGRSPSATSGAGASPGAPKPISYLWLIWQGAEVVSLPAAGDTTAQTAEQHRFLVGTEAGPFVVTVSVVETPETSQPALGAMPTITPYVYDPDAVGLDQLEWGSVGFDTSPPSESLRSRVEEWAAAFAGDDRRGLLELAGDRRQGVQYIGLGDWSVASVDAGGVVGRDDGRFGMRVDIVLVSVGDPSLQVGASYDLLVESAQDPLPGIVAWGPPGSALTLEPHQNATPTPEQGTATSTATSASVVGSTTTTAGGR